MLDSASMPTPMTHSSRLISFEGIPLTKTNSSTYCKLISRFIYLTKTIPDIAFSVNNLSQFLSSPTKAHQQDVFHILRYLKSNSSIFFNHNSSIKLCGYNDSDWATYPETRKSITGFSIFLGESLCFMNAPSTLRSNATLSEKRSLLDFLSYFLYHLHYKLSTSSQSLLLQLLFTQLKSKLVMKNMYSQLEEG